MANDEELEHVRSLMLLYRDAWVDRKIEDFGWDELVLLARRMLEVRYPASIFPSGEYELNDRDPGVQFVVHLRAALEALP